MNLYLSAKIRMVEIERNYISSFFFLFYDKKLFCGRDRDMIKPSTSTLFKDYEFCLCTSAVQRDTQSIA